MKPHIQICQRCQHFRDFVTEELRDPANMARLNIKSELETECTLPFSFLFELTNLPKPLVNRMRGGSCSLERPPESRMWWIYGLDDEGINYDKQFQIPHNCPFQLEHKLV